jgi:tetraacyldisaccharide 4'-kinase
MKKIRSVIFTYVTQVIHKERKNLFLQMVLWLISQCWKSWVFCKYHIQKIMDRPRKISALTVSIGNIVAGGVGKTPFLILLAKYFQKASIGILSSGYRSQNENKALQVLPLHTSSWEEMGDEPAMIKQYYPFAHFFIGRKFSYEKISEIDLLLIDDGMQKRSIKKDFEIAILGKDNLFGYHHFLPYGLLRDFPKRLQDCDMIVVNHIDDEQQLLAAENAIRKYSKAPVIGTKPKMVAMKDVLEQEVDIRSQPIAVFCSIGNPQSFCHMLKQEGYQITHTLFHPDHESFSFNELKDFFDRSQASALVCTKKDWIKLKRKSGLPLYYVEMELTVSARNCQFENFIAKIKKMLYNPREAKEFIKS